MSLRSPLTILLIDDDAEDRLLYRCFLEEDTLYTYRIFEFERTTEAMAWCQQEIPDVILLDFLLPDGDGLGFLQQFREKFDNTQSAAIMLTGYGDETIAVQAMKNNAQDYLIKSKLTGEALQRAIHHAVERTHLTFELQQSRELQLIGNIALRIRQSLKLEEILQTTTTEVRQFLKADRVLVYQFSPDMSGIIVAESVLPGWSVALGRYVEDTCFQQGVKCNYQLGEKRANNDIYQAGLTKCHLQLLEQFEVKANLVVPILEANQLWGLLIVHQCAASRHWKQVEIHLLEQLGVQIAIAIQQATAYEQLQTELIQRKQAEVALQESKEIFHQLAQTVEEVFLIQNADFSQTIYVSPGYERIWQRSPEELYQNPTAWLESFYPEDRECLFAEMYRVMSGEKCQTEYRILKRCGELRWILVQAFPVFDDAGKIYRTIISAQDITDRKQAEEERLRSEMLQIELQLLEDILETAQAGYWEWNIPNNVGYLSPTFKQMFGYGEQELANPSESWQSLFFAEDLPELLLYFQQNIKNSHQIPSYQELKYRHKNGSPVWAICSSRVIEWDKDDNPLRIIGCNIDITKSKESEEQLKLTNEQLANTNTQLARATQLKDEFLANMSHELRTPLNAILGMAEGLQEGVFASLNEQQAKAIATIERSGRHLLELINEILDLSKIESGKLELLLSDVSVENLCNSSLVFVRQMAFKKNIDLNTNISHNLGNIQVDDCRLRQVLINLLSNAIKFTPEGGNVKLKVWLEESKSSPYSLLYFSVTDTGIGITPENINKLFQPFIQLDSSLSRQYSGTGLGLSLVKRITILHGGTVSVSSEVGKGSCFTVSIPYHPNPQLQPIREELKYDEIPPQQPALEAPLILLAEDNQATIDTMSGYLESRGYSLILATNGQQAIDFVVSSKPDLIVMDIQMPVMDGLEAIRHIRKQLVSVPIIALTALAMSGDRETCLAAGANEYLTKPVKLQQLVATIQKLLISSKHS